MNFPRSPGKGEARRLKARQAADTAPAFGSRSAKGSTRCFADSARGSPSIAGPRLGKPVQFLVQGVDLSLEQEDAFENLVDFQAARLRWRRRGGRCGRTIRTCHSDGT